MISQIPDSKGFISRLLTLLFGALSPFAPLGRNWMNIGATYSQNGFNTGFVIACGDAI